MRNRALLTAVVSSAIMLGAGSSSAQSVRGVAADVADRPLGGAILQLLDSTSRVVARSLTNDRGEFRLSAVAAGTYRIRALRIGYRPWMSEPLHLAVDEDVLRRLGVASVRVDLDTVHVVARNSCTLARDSSAATFAVWEQMRTALTAAQITGRARITGAMLTYENVLEPVQLRLLKQNSSISSHYINQPWRGLAADSLHRVGYVAMDEHGTTTFSAPGLDVLLAPSFMDDHCFSLRDEGQVLGVEFTPSPDRSGVPEIHGVLRIDRRSAELRSLEFGYVNVSRAERERARGVVHFARMRDGTWAIVSWSIDMPVAELPISGGVRAADDAKVLEIVRTGGQLIAAQRGGDTIYSVHPLILGGSVTDSSSGRGIPRSRVSVAGTSFAAITDDSGRFRIEGLLRGNYTLEVATPSLDSMNTVHQSALAFDDSTVVVIRVPTGNQVMATLCRSKTRTHPGMLMGNVLLRGDTMPAQYMTVRAEWTGGDGRQVRQARADSRGAFLVCDVPLNTDIVVRSISDSGGSGSEIVRIPPARRFARVDVVHDQSLRGKATLAGFVFSDSLKQPLSGAQVIISDLQRSTVTNEQGAFRLTDIAPGAHQLSVRRFGYAPVEAELLFHDNEQVDRQVFLERATTLDALHVTESPLPRVFEENRKAGFGTFLTRENLDSYNGLDLASALGTVQGVELLHGSGGHVFFLSKRTMTSLCATEECIKAGRRIYLPTAAERGEGIIRACYGLVYLDDILLNPGRPTEPFDITSIAIEQIAGIEIYPSNMQAPIKYGGRDANCGIMQIWTRRAR